MATANSSTERKNHLVWDQLELGAYKQALQLCNRRIKKGEKNENLLVNHLSLHPKSLIN